MPLNFFDAKVYHEKEIKKQNTPFRVTVCTEGAKKVGLTRRLPHENRKSNMVWCRAGFLIFHITFDDDSGIEENF